MAENDSNRPAVNVTVVGLSDVGRVREHNEDSFLVLDAGAHERQQNGERRQFDVSGPVVLAVADGMGGAAAGEVASHLAVERFGQDMGGSDLTDTTPDQLMAKIDQTLQAANDDILQNVEANPDRKGMGTTFTSAVVVGGTAFVAQVGDSRGYLLRKGKLLRITRDQSLIEQLIEEGTITEEEAEKMGGHNIILQALGVEQHVRPDTKAYPILRGDVYLLCSDGLSGMIKDDRMEQILNEAGDDLVEAAQRLIQGANDNGGKDNITVVLARFDGEGLRPPMAAAEQSDIEQTGVRFKAPPPPEVPNPMRKLSIVGGLILAALALILFFAGQSSTDLTLHIDPPGLTVDVTLTDEATGKEVSAQHGAAGKATIEGLTQGKYSLVVKADHYFERTLPLEIKQSGSLEKRISLDPRPAELTVTCSESHTEFELVSGGSEAKPFSGQLEPESPARYGNFPAGMAKLSARREGFADYDVEIDLQPDSKVAHAIVLKELRGTIHVSCSEPGFSVRVVDRWGEERSAPVTLGADAQSIDVRVGQLEVEASKSGFETQRKVIDVGSGKVVDVEFDAVREKAIVSFRSHASFDGYIQFRDESGEWTKKVNAYARDGEPSRAHKLEPGRYRIVYRSGGKELEKQFDVTPDAVGTAIVVDLDS